MSKYYGALRRGPAEPETVVHPDRTDEQGQGWDETRVDRNGQPIIDMVAGMPGAAPHYGDAETGALVPLPTLREVPGEVARRDEIRRISERLAPLAVVDNSVRVLISGCRPGDGASTVAAALALDLSQRMSLRTMVVDAHLRKPTLHRFFVQPGRRPPELTLDGSLQIRPAGWPRLDLATCCLTGGEPQRKALMDQFENLLASYPAVVVDLGVTRLDARMLPLARPTDPVLLVVRYGHTERNELATTTAALRAANRTVAGVILNAATDPVAKPIRRLISRE